MTIFTFLFDIIKLLATLAMGVLSLSIAFADKLNLDFKDEKIRNTISLLWANLIAVLLLCVISGLFLYSDMDIAIHTGKTITRKVTKLFTILTLISFILVLFSLTKIGKIIIRQRSKKE